MVQQTLIKAMSPQMTLYHEWLLGCIPNLKNSWSTYSTILTIAVILTPPPPYKVHFVDFYFRKLYVPGSLKSKRVHEKLSPLFNRCMVNVPLKSNIACSSNSSTDESGDGPSLNVGVSNSRDCLDIMKIGPWHHEFHAIARQWTSKHNPPFEPPSHYLRDITSYHGSSTKPLWRSPRSCQGHRFEPKALKVLLLWC